jgi:hypothetical protein
MSRTFHFMQLYRLGEPFPVVNDLPESDQKTPLHYGK